MRAERSSGSSPITVVEARHNKVLQPELGRYADSSSPWLSRSRAAVKRHSIVPGQSAIMAVLDGFMAAFNRQDAAEEERTYQFSHYRLASGRMAVLNEPGAETRAWMNGADKAFRDWDHIAWTHRRIVHVSDSKARIDT